MSQFGEPRVCYFRQLPRLRAAALAVTSVQVSARSAQTTAFFSYPLVRLLFLHTL